LYLLSLDSQHYLIFFSLFGRLAEVEESQGISSTAYIVLTLSLLVNFN
jgi:hypothetical protein